MLHQIVPPISVDKLVPVSISYFRIERAHWRAVDILVLLLVYDSLFSLYQNGTIVAYLTLTEYLL